MKRRCATLPHPLAGACSFRPTRTARGESDLSPSRPTLALSERAFIRVGEIPAALKRHANEDIQGTVSRSGEVLLLALDPGEESPAW